MPGPIVSSYIMYLFYALVPQFLLDLNHMVKIGELPTNINKQVVQVVTKLYPPILGGHQQALKGSRQITIPKNSQRIAT